MTYFFRIFCLYIDKIIATPSVLEAKVEQYIIIFYQTTGSVSKRFWKIRNVGLMSRILFSNVSKFITNLVHGRKWIPIVNIVDNNVAYWETDS
jgi:hypothetical protein